MSRSFSFIKAAAAATVATSLVSSVSQAALTIDLRFTDGSHSKSINAGELTPITINAWAVATGTAGNSAEEGLQSVIAAVKSNILTAGFTGGITSASIGTSWGGTGSFTGSASNLSADSIGDWGNASNTPLTVNAASGFFRVRTTKSAENQIDWGDGNSTGTFNNLADGGAEFLIGSFTFTPTAAPAGASLQYAPVTPLGGTTAPAGWYEDTADKTIGSPSGSKTVLTGSYGPATPNNGLANAVQIDVIGVPEPTTLGLLGLGAMGLIRRRRA